MHKKNLLKFSKLRMKIKEMAKFWYDPKAMW